MITVEKQLGYTYESGDSPEDQMVKRRRGSGQTAAWLQGGLPFRRSKNSLGVGPCSGNPRRLANSWYSAFSS